VRKLIDWFEERINLTEIVSFLGSFGIFYLPLDTAKKLREALRTYNERLLPAYTRFPQILGLITFFLFILSGITGVLLLFYYQPSTKEAFESVKYITRAVNFGFYVRELHRWSGHFLIAFLFFRILRFSFQGIFRKPREFLWIVAVLMLFLSFFEGITGNLLPLSQRAYWSTVRALEAVGSIPIVGPLFFFLLGGKEITESSFTRFFALHSVVFPSAFIFLFYLHFNIIRKTGLTVRKDRGGFIRFFPDYFLESIIILLLIFGFLLTLGIFFPAKDIEVAKPYFTPPGIHPPWYLLPLYGVCELTSSFLGGFLFLIFSFSLILVPFFVKGENLLILRIFIFALLLTLFFLGLAGYFAEVPFAK